MNYILFDDDTKKELLPLSYTRPVSEFRVGILTIREKWERVFGKTFSHYCNSYLDDLFPVNVGNINIMINSSYFVSDNLITEINNLEYDQQLIDDNGTIIAVKIYGERLQIAIDKKTPLSKLDVIKSHSNYKHERLLTLWDIFQKNGSELAKDFAMITKGRDSKKVSDTNTLIGDAIFIEKGVEMECAVLNATDGPIYIGKNAEIMEGSMVRGPFALCENSTLKMASKIYGATTIGPHSKVGGEVSNSVIFGYSNKAHDGFLGNSVLGEWCNLGADTNNSNLKNNYAEVALWNYPKEGFVNTGTQFCGLIMGDHSKCGINTMFNTGTVVGVSSNIFGAGFPQNFIPSFSWGGGANFTNYKFDKAIEIAQMVMARRGKELNAVNEQIFREVHKISQKYWE